ncbi:hypothetical protein ACJJTC_002893 [Scirpophaga incertulas]
MPKWTFIIKLLQVHTNLCVFCILFCITIAHFFSLYGEYNYAHIPEEKLLDELHKELASNYVVKKNKPECTYNSILKSKQCIKNWELKKEVIDFSANSIANGSYAPTDCNPMFSVAILVTYRNRQKHLDTFLPYMHNFLRKQKIHYKIYLIEQQDNKKWNKGTLYNIGARHAIAEKFPCLILQDVDLLPLDEANLYVCTKQPRHMSASIDKFRYVLPYTTLVGGVLAIRADQYIKINGFSNKYEGWGGEDDDFAKRIISHNMDIIRFPRRMSRYSMLRHPQEPKNAMRVQLLADSARFEAAGDGFALPAALNVRVRVRTERLFTHLLVRL